MISLNSIIFLTDVTIHYFLLLGVVWSVLLPQKRAWPPPRKWSWQYTVTWVLFYMVLALNILLIVLDWDSWTITDDFRFFAGIPMILMGGLLVSWGILFLGAKNTCGLKDKMIFTGPYYYTRNPQYLGDIILFIGITLIANSLYVAIVHFLMILIFSIAPWCEETWLEQHYGEDYIKYKSMTPRFL